MKKTLAWCVHGYTALGLVAAGGMAVAIVGGGPEGARWAFFLMLAATLVDATDGTLARLVQVKQVLPGFDGRRLDDIIDFQTFTALPLLLLWRTQTLGPGMEGWLLVPLLASAYGFCQVAAKTDDGYFRGFPSYWNIVAFYFYVLQLPPPAALALLLFFSFLTFAPTRYLYPTHHGRINRWTNILGAIWGVLLLWIIIRLPASSVDGRHADEQTLSLAMISLFFPAYYLGVSWWISWRLSRRRI